MNNKTTTATTTHIRSTLSDTAEYRVGFNQKFNAQKDGKITMPTFTIINDDQKPIVKIYNDGRVVLTDANRVNEGADIFFNAFCSQLDTRAAGGGYRDAIFERLLAVCEENGGVLTKEDLTNERKCVIIEERLKGVR